MRNIILFTISSLAITVALLFGQAQQQGASPRPAPKGAVEGRLTWFDRQGKIAAAIGEPGLYRTLMVSADGKQVAFEHSDPQTQNRDIWIIDSAGGMSRRFTSDPGWDAFPTWSPDSKRLVFTSNRSGNYELYVKNVNGGDEELFYKSSDGKGPTSWSPDGRFLVYYSLGQPTHVKLLAFNGPADRQPTPVVDPQFTSITARFSPDGRWIAYTSNESGASEVSVRSFDPASGSIGKPVVITKDGGRAPLWRGDGKEMFYITQDGTATAIDIDTRTGFKAGTPKALFNVPAAVLFWDAAPAGTRFLMPAASR
ncbi:MAG: PD40 domain-containing protein [Bryobacterales bacterium]|nr:PD40 domain-containing protein [Bryobacterales bacterium]